MASFARALSKLKNQSKLDEALMRARLGSDIAIESQEIEAAEDDYEGQTYRNQMGLERDALKDSSVGAMATGAGTLAAVAGAVNPLVGAGLTGLGSLFGRSRNDKRYSVAVDLKSGKFGKNRRAALSDNIQISNDYYAMIGDQQSLVNWAGALTDAMNVYRMGNTFASKAPAFKIPEEEGFDLSSFYESSINMQGRTWQQEDILQRFNNIYQGMRNS